MPDPPRVLVVVEDHHAESELRRVLDTVRSQSAVATVLTSDALLGLRLRREGVDARLTTDGLARDTLVERDRVALAGVGIAFAPLSGARPMLDYTLIPAFMRAVRNLTAAADQLANGSFQRSVLVGGGPLIAAARLAARRRGVFIEQVGGPIQRIGQAWRRLRAGRATKWVNTDFRALVLEPGFIALMFVKGFWRAIAGPPRPRPTPRALVVVGDRFTADVVDRLRAESRPLIVAGATEPGRALFQSRPHVPLEAFADLLDPLRCLGSLAYAVADAISLARADAHEERFAAAGASYWPLVKWTVFLHLVVWLPILEHVRSLMQRAARAYPDARLLCSTDVTAYNRVLIETARRANVQSMGIQHGIPGEPNGHSIVRVDTLAVWGTATEPWYRALAPQSAEFVVTGNPRFDALAGRPLAPLPQGPFTIVVCTGFMSDFSVGASELENLLMIDAVLAWAEGHDGVRVVHKMHPGEEPEYYTAAARSLGWSQRRLTTVREPILYDVLEQSHVLVAAYSTTVLEALALGTPAIVFDAIVQRKLLPLDRVPGVTIALSIDELAGALDRHRAGPRFERDALRSSAALGEYISQLDGRATERVATLVTTIGSTAPFAETTPRR